MSSFKDPQLAAKLLKFIDALRAGCDVGAATRSAELDRETANVFLDSIKNHLLGQAGAPRSTDSPQRPKTEKLSRSRTAGKRATSKPLRLVAVCDGASRGNPGQAACAVVLTDADDGAEVLSRAKRLGVATNNVAEYEGVILALELATMLGASELKLKLDSELVARQLNAEYKVKHPSLKPLFLRAQELGRAFDRLEVIHVPRDETQAADKMANDALDGKDDADLE